MSRMRTLELVGKKYLTFVELTKAKARPTLEKERCALNGWFDFIGQTRLVDITGEDLNEYALARSEEGISNRTINLDILALKHVLVFARDSGLLKGEKSLVTDSWKPLKHTSPQRKLMAHTVIYDLCQEALKPGKYHRGQFLADYIKLMAYSGARKTAALTAKWSNVDWVNRQITFFTKFDKHVVVDMNPRLEELLKDMASRRTESDYLFPGDFNGHQGDPHKLFNDVRIATSHPGVTMHDFRHYFASYAVMATQDVLLVARWLGHADGGKLVMKVYGHLCIEHRQTSAAKVTF